MKNLFIDIHVLQTLPPNNINRDETGSPKTAIFGGVVRQRVSSQAFKRAVREDLRQSLTPQQLGLRTKDAPSVLASEIQKISDVSHEDALSWSVEALKATGLKPEKPTKKKDQEEKPEETKYLVFLGQFQLEKLAKLAADVAGVFDASAKKEAKSILKENQAVDVALFGRMVADATDLNVDASVQVAHSLGVHESTPEFDYYTAVDDLRGEDEQGADMIGTVEFTASTLYRYATINIRGLQDTLGDAEAVSQAAAAFTESFIRSMPTGKQNSFANRTLPGAVVVSLNEGQPCSWVGAFEKPVKAGSDGYLKNAVQALASHAQELDSMYSSSPTRLVASLPSLQENLLELGEKTTVDGLAEQVRKAAAACLQKDAE